MDMLLEHYLGDKDDTPGYYEATDRQLLLHMMNNQKAIFIQNILLQVGKRVVYSILRLSLRLTLTLTLPYVIKN